jgi:ankyrin repeat protein
MSILLRSDDRDEQSGNGVGNNSPLARYAAEHWVAHAQFKHVSSYLRTSMETLFDLDKPYFASWLELYDIDTDPSNDSTFFVFITILFGDKHGTSPLYYAALCGFQDLVQNLIVKYPQHVNASGGCYLTPLVAALAGKHFQTAELLRHSGADPNVQWLVGNTPLHSAASLGDVEMVQELLDMGADVNFQNERGESPLDYTCRNPHQADDTFPIILGNVTQLLLDRGADINARTNDSWTPLHTAVHYGYIEVVRVLLEHGADVGSEDKQGKTPFTLAKEGHYEIMKLLLEHGTRP